MELLERVHSIRPETPVVVMTVDSTAEKIVSAIRDNAFSWFRKPFAAQEVRDMVDSALTALRVSKRHRNTFGQPALAGTAAALRSGNAAARPAIRTRDGARDCRKTERESVALAFREILFQRGGTRRRERSECPCDGHLYAGGRRAAVPCARPRAGIFVRQAEACGGVESGRFAGRACHRTETRWGCGRAASESC